MVEVELVAEGAVGADGFAFDLCRQLRNEAPVRFFAGFVEEILEGAAGRSLVGDIVCSVFGELFVVALDFLVRWFELMLERHWPPPEQIVLESVRV